MLKLACVLIVSIRANWGEFSEQDSTYTLTRTVDNSLYEDNEIGGLTDHKDGIHSTNYTRNVNNDLYADKKEKYAPPIYETIMNEETKSGEYDFMYWYLECVNSWNVAIKLIFTISVEFKFSNVTK